MTLRRKLLLTYGLVAGLFLLVTLIAGNEMLILVRNSERLLERNLPLLKATDDIREALDREHAFAMQALLVPATAIDLDMEASNRLLRSRLADARRLITAPAEFAILENFERSYERLWSDLGEWRKAGTRLPPDRARLAERFADTRAASLGLYQMNLSALAHAAEQANRRASLSLLLLPFLGALTLLVGVMLSVRFVGRITAPLEDLAGAAQRLGEGNFDVQFRLESRSDEIDSLAARFSEMAGSLQRFARLNVNKLIAERRRNDAILESISDGLVVMDEAGRIERMNPVAVQQLGPFEDDPVGATIGALLGRPEIDAQVRSQLAPPGEQLPAGSFDLVVDRHGERRILSYALLPFAEPGGTGHGLIMTLRDVTLEREFEAMRSSFVMRASHELRTPVTSIRMGLDLLREKLELAPQSLEKELLETVMAETQRLVRLLTDLLDLSRFQTGDQRLDKQACDVAELLTRAEQRFRATAEESGITLACDLPAPPLPPCTLDAMQIDRVLDNLIGNALRHTPRGGRIALEAHQRGHGIEISVTDTGEGIAYAQQARIFKPFVQVGRRRGGAGLGLAIAREIVQQHGGAISLVSVPNRGTTFSVQLPA